MLILTRKIHQSVVIGGILNVKILGVERDQVKLGFSAPRELLILREELSTSTENDQVELVLPKLEWIMLQKQPKTLTPPKVEDQKWGFRDKNLACRNCGKTFVFSVNEQRFFMSKGFKHEPSRCQRCRAEKRSQKRTTS